MEPATNGAAEAKPAFEFIWVKHWDIKAEFWSGVLLLAALFAVIAVTSWFFGRWSGRKLKKEEVLALGLGLEGYFKIKWMELNHAVILLLVAAGIPTLLFVTAGESTLRVKDFEVKTAAVGLLVLSLAVGALILLQPKSKK